MNVRVGIIGTGVMGADHVRTLVTAVAGADVVAVSDTNLRRVHRVAAEAGDCRVHVEPLELVNDADVDAIVIASPDDTHEKFLLACLEVGKPVLCEKPLAATAEGCLRLVEAEVASDRQLVQVGFMRRFDPAYIEMKRVLDSGAVGEPLLMHCVHRNAAASITSGMLMTTSAIHEIDVARWLLGQEIVTATVHTPRASGFAPRGLQDPQFVVLETEGGVLVNVEVFVNARYGYDVRCELVGESGTVSVLPPATLAVRVDGSERQSVPGDFRTQFAAAYRNELQSWVDAVAVGEIHGPSTWDGYVAVAVAQACIESTTTGRAVAVRLVPRPRLFG